MIELDDLLQSICGVLFDKSKYCWYFPWQYVFDELLFTTAAAAVKYWLAAAAAAAAILSWKTSVLGVVGKFCVKVEDDKEDERDDVEEVRPGAERLYWLESDCWLLDWLWKPYGFMTAATAACKKDPLAKSGN